MITQLITAHSLADQNGIKNDHHYLFSFQITDEGHIRIVTTNDIEVFYNSIHDFLLAWKGITSLGWAKDKETFQKMLDDLQGPKDH